jgi:hypothetical protein
MTNEEILKVSKINSISMISEASNAPRLLYRLENGTTDSFSLNKEEMKEYINMKGHFESLNDDYFIKLVLNNEINKLEKKTQERIDLIDKMLDKN